MTPAAILTRIRDRLSPACAAEIDRFAAIYGEESIVDALGMNKAEAQIRRAIVRAWLGHGMSVHGIARLLGCDRKTVSNARSELPRPRKVPQRRPPAPHRGKPKASERPEGWAAVMARPLRVREALAETRERVAAMRRSA